MSRTCVQCGHSPMTAFEGAAETLEHAGLTARVTDLAGWRCPLCGEVEWDDESVMRYAAASDDLVQRVRDQRSREIRRIRKKLGLSQQAAARLTGGGHNAFSRYERGIADPLPAVVNLFALLDRHPELLAELEKGVGEGDATH